MVDLRPLVIVTGTVRVAGGGASTTRRRRKQNGHTTITLDRRMTDDRREANVIVTHYLRRLRKIAVLRTPYGVLVAAERSDDVKTLLAEVTRMIAEYNNAKPRACGLSNCVLRERLRGERLTAVAGWIAARADDDRVKAAIPALLDPQPHTAVASET
jgi:hypothetical protein